jgi:hypothetical protein
VAALAIENDRLVVRLSVLEHIGGTVFEAPSAPLAAVYGRRPGVVVDLEGARWTRFVVSADDPDAVVAELERGGLRRLSASS